MAWYISIRFWVGFHYFTCIILACHCLYQSSVKLYKRAPLAAQCRSGWSCYTTVCTSVQARNCENPELRVVLSSLKFWYIWSSTSFQFSDKLAAVISNATDNFWNPNFYSDTTLLSPQSFKVFNRYMAHIHLLLTSK